MTDPTKDAEYLTMADKDRPPPQDKAYSLKDDLKDTFKEHKDAVEKVGRGVKAVYQGIFGKPE